MTQMNYYYGQNAESQMLKLDNDDKYLAMMNSESEMVFQNGSDSKLFAWLGTAATKDPTTVYAQTDDESLVGT